LASQRADIEGAVGDGRYDVHLKIPNGPEFVIELKYYPFQDQEDPEIDAEDRKAMRKKALAALKQIDAKNYAKRYKGVGSELYKAALVIGGRTEVLIVFKKDTVAKGTSGKSAANSPK
jgi:hypothetical protein